MLSGIFLRFPCAGPGDPCESLPTQNILCNFLYKLFKKKRLEESFYVKYGIIGFQIIYSTEGIPSNICVF